MGNIEKQLEIVRALSPLVINEQLITLIGSLAMLINRFRHLSNNDQMTTVKYYIEKYLCQELGILEKDLIPTLTTLDTIQTIMVKQNLIGFLNRAAMYLEAEDADAFENAMVKFPR